MKLIAEPWDIGEGGYQVGNFPPPFAEWNDHSAMRRDAFGSSVISRWASCRAFAASSDVFKRQGRKPSATVNLVTAHDGLRYATVCASQISTMKRMVRKIATALAITTADNHGKEGLGGTLDLIERRRDSIHALLTTLLLSQGTPMLLAGDEHGHSQHGNNNAYCQDTPNVAGLATGKQWANHIYRRADSSARQIPALTGDVGGKRAMAMFVG